MVLLPVAWLVVFMYLPMYGNVIAFKRFVPARGILGSDWIGFAHFIRFFESFKFREIMWNTFYLNAYDLVFGFPIPIVLALILHYAPWARYRKTVQMVTYAPHFISTVVVVSIMYFFLSPRIGVVNSIIQLLGGEAIFFMASPAWGPSLFVLSELWQNAGFNAIIFLAALSAVDPSLREAAFCDGANKLQIIWHVDLPWIMPTIVILFIMRLGQLLTIGFEKVLLMQNDLNLSTLEVVATYTYRSGILQAQYDYATAVGLLETVVNFAILVLANRLARRVGQTSLW